MKKGLASLYKKSVLDHPLVVLVVLLMLLLFFSYHAKDFTLDASADSLMLEDDKDLQTFREFTERYGVQEFLVVTFQPKETLFSQKTLSLLRKLRDRLQQVESVDSVESILDIPLLRTSGFSLSEISADSIKTLEDPSVDLLSAKKEILQNPIYKEYVINADGTTTGLKLNLKTDTALAALQKKRSRLLIKRRSGTITHHELSQLQTVLVEYETASAAYNEWRHLIIQEIRSLIRPYEQYGTVYLGGVPMIADDMITFIGNDLIVFGLGVFVFIIITLTIIFREIRWVVLPLLCCLFAVMIMVGMLGFLHWNVTVISSNFISLMLILTLSMNIHLTVRYRQLCRDMKTASQIDTVFATARKMVWPCLYAALTTILGFGSLVFSGIRPVIDFGWMMTIGLTVTFLTSFLLFPCVLMLLKKPAPQTGAVNRQSAITTRLASIALTRRRSVIVLAVIFALISVTGIMSLKVENSFSDYFRQDTEIYKGLKFIDTNLGGTMPLDVVLRFGEPRGDGTDRGPVDEQSSDDDDFDWVDDYDPRDYWFTPFKIEMIKKVHDYLDGLPGVGKVVSLASVIRVAEQLNEGEPLDSLELGVLYKKIPEQMKTAMVNPYVSFEQNEARISLRVLDSSRELRRKELLEQITDTFSSTFGLGKDRATLTGLVVLYNNMLQSLFRSQILTLGVVMLGIGIMLLILFRSLTLSLIGIVPNLLAVGTVLGIMGLMNIPLDMMTITIAAITMGIAIDNSIHYIYRFKEEFAGNGDYIETLHICHGSVGRAILNTSITIIFGFSILVLSNFIPTIYFGIFTGLAMLIAMLAVLTLLPCLILLWKPFKTIAI